MSHLSHIVRVLAVISAAIAAPAVSHHSPVMFDLNVTDFAITGKIAYVDMRNPHSVMELLVEDADGSAVEWNVEFSSVNLLLRRGWDLERIRAGDTVTCIGNPRKDGSAAMYMWSIVLSDGTEFNR